MISISTTGTKVLPVCPQIERKRRTPGYVNRDSQIKEMRDLAEREGLRIVETKQESYSAKQSGNRPVFNELSDELLTGLTEVEPGLQQALNKYVTQTWCIPHTPIKYR